MSGFGGGGNEYDLPFTQKLGMVMSNLDSMRHGRGAMYDPSAMMKLAKDQRDDRLAKEARAKKDEFGRKFAIKAGQLHLWEADRSGYSDAVIGDQYSGIKEEMETSRKREKIKPILEAIKRDGSPQLKKFAEDNPEAAVELYLEERKKTIGYESDPAYQQLQQLFNGGGGGAPEEISPEETVEESGAAVVGGAPEEGIEEISNAAVDESGAAVVGGVDPNLLNNLQRHYSDPDLTQQEAILIRNAVMANSKGPSAALMAGQEMYDKILTRRNEQKGIDEKEINNAEDLRKEFDTGSKLYDGIISAAQRADVVASDPQATPLDRITVMFELIRGLDPAGSVRESDTDLMASAQSYRDTLGQWMKTISEGGMISESAIKDMAGALARLGNDAAGRKLKLSDDIRSMADARKINKSMVFGTLRDGPSQNVPKPIAHESTQLRRGVAPIAPDNIRRAALENDAVEPGDEIKDPRTGINYVVDEFGNLRKDMRGTQGG